MVMGRSRLSSRISYSGNNLYRDPSLVASLRFLEYGLVVTEVLCIASNEAGFAGLDMYLVENSSIHSVHIA